MADKESDVTVLEGEEALALLRKGNDAWNKWAEDNPGAKVSFYAVEFKYWDADFEGFVFPGEANFIDTKFSGDARFYDATFSGNTKFNGATFSGEVNFWYATFSEEAWFHKTTFSGDAEFNYATFSGDATFERVKFKELINFKKCTFEEKANFSDANFGSSVNLTNAKFDMVPDFRRTKLSAHFTLHGVIINSQKHTDSEDTDRLCRLKELASIAKDHVREQDFFALELKAKRSHKSPSLLRKVANVIFITLYQLFSNFGRSVALPLFLLLVVWFSCGMYFACLSCSTPDTGIGKGLTTSASLIFPFLGASRDSLGGGFDGLDAVVAFFEGLLGVMFLFLIGLALRNRFRI